MADARATSFDLLLRLLREEDPKRYRTWVTWSAGVCAFCYLVSCLLVLHGGTWSGLLGMANPYVVVVDVIALGLIRVGKPRAAAALVLLGLWSDIHYSLATTGAELASANGIIAPIFVLGTGLLLGGRAAFIAAAVTAVTMPLTLLTLAPTWADNHARELFIISLVGTMLGTSILLGLYLRSFARILEQREAAEAKARELQRQLLHSQKLEAVGLLAGGIAHDFNNLLTAMGGFGSLVARSTDPKTRQFGDEIVAAQKRGAALVRQLLAFARKDVPQPKPVDLGHNLDELRPLVERLLGERIALRIEHTRPCPIVIDPSGFEQLVLNLAANARDAMLEGGTLTLSCTANDNEVTLRVQDDGKGIEPDVLERIFDPFFTTKDRHRGTGLGLSTVHGIVTDSDGRIAVASTPGQGTTFTIRWPVSPLSVAPPAPPIQHEATSGAGRRILLVDDHRPARTYVAELLKEHGYAVTVAEHAEAALDAIEGERRRPDLLLTDVAMPGLSGPQLANALRKRWPELPVLYMSGYVADLIDGAKLPTTDFIAKPFEGPALLQRVAEKLADAKAA